MTSPKPAVSIRRAPVANPALVEQFVTAGADKAAFPSSRASVGVPETRDSSPADLPGGQTPAPLDVREPRPPETQGVERRGAPVPGFPAVQGPESVGAQDAGGRAVQNPTVLGVPEPGLPKAQEAGRSHAPAPGTRGSQALDARGAQVSGDPDLQTSEPADVDPPATPDGKPAEGQGAQPSNAAAHPSMPPAPPPGRDPAATPAATRRGLVQRQDGRVRRRTTVYLPPELIGELTTRCVYDGRELSDAIADALRSYLKSG